MVKDSFSISVLQFLCVDHCFTLPPSNHLRLLASLWPSLSPVGPFLCDSFIPLVLPFPCLSACRCRMCAATFLNKSDMQIHSKSHTEAKPHKCPHCDKSFANSSYLAQHIRIHSGAKPYTCSYCQKSFRQLSHLQQHTRYFRQYQPVMQPCTTFRCLSACQDPLEPQAFKSHFFPLREDVRGACTQIFYCQMLIACIHAIRNAKCCLVLDDPRKVSLSFPFHLCGSLLASLSTFASHCPAWHFKILSVFYHISLLFLHKCTYVPAMKVQSWFHCAFCFNPYITCSVHFSVPFCFLLSVLCSILQPCCCFLFWLSKYCYTFFSWTGPNWCIYCIIEHNQVNFICKVRMMMFSETELCN